VWWGPCSSEHVRTLLKPVLCASVLRYHESVKVLNGDMQFNGNVPKLPPLARRQFEEHYNMTMETG